MILWLLYILPPIVMIILDDNRTKTQQRYVSSTIGLFLIMHVGHITAVETVVKSLTNSQKIHLFSTWLLVNITVLIVYYYIYSVTPMFMFFYLYEFWVPPDIVEFAALYGFIFIGSLY